jgi:archaellum component FlaC
MKKYILIGVGLLSLYSYSNAQTSQICCYDTPTGKEEYATKEYVDSKFAPIFQKLDDINSRANALSKELSNLKNTYAGLDKKVADLEAALNSLKSSCPSACNAKLSEVEKNIAELKE